MSNRNYNTQTNPNRQKLMNGGRAKKNMGGSMNPAMARQDMASGYYPSDMGMEGGAMYKKGGKVTKKNIQLEWILNHQELVAELQILEFQQLEDLLLSMIKLEQTMLV